MYSYLSVLNCFELWSDKKEIGKCYDEDIAKSICKALNAQEHDILFKEMENMLKWLGISAFTFDRSWAEGFQSWKRDIETYNAPNFSWSAGTRYLECCFGKYQLDCVSRIKVVHELLTDFTKRALKVQYDAKLDSDLDLIKKGIHERLAGKR